MRDDQRGVFQIELRRLAQLPSNPRSTDWSVRFILERVGDVDNSAAGLARNLPVGPGELFVGGEEGEIHALKLVAADWLNKRYFVFHGIQLPQRFVVIEQAYVVGGEIAVFQRFFQFFALERGSAHNRDTKQIGRFLALVLHLGSGTSWYVGDGGRRRKTHEIRIRIPLTA